MTDHDWQFFSDTTAKCRRCGLHVPSASAPFFKEYCPPAEPDHDYAKGKPHPPVTHVVDEAEPEKEPEMSDAGKDACLCCRETGCEPGCRCNKNAPPEPSAPARVGEVAEKLVAHVFPSMDREMMQRNIKACADILRPYFPAQPSPTPRCPKCGETNLSLYAAPNGTIRVHCNNDQTHLPWEVESVADFAQFFQPAAPSAEKPQ